MEIGVGIGDFEVIEHLGQGGMGQVYLAEDQQLARRVAIKVVTEHLRTDEEARLRLLQEARLASSLNHPNICTIHQVVSTQSERYVVMEHVQGVTLAEKLEHGALPPEEVLAHGLGMAAGLSHAHAHDILHRDLKPSNVMITADGRAKILDFGVAQRDVGNVADATTVSGTISGRIAGTPLYMAPEHMRGGRPDPRSDIWALGVVLYEALSRGSDNGSSVNGGGLIRPIVGPAPHAGTGRGDPGPPRTRRAGSSARPGG